MSAWKEVRTGYVIWARRCEYHPAGEEGLIALRTVVVMSRVVTCWVAADREHLTGRERAERWIPASAALAGTRFEPHTTDFAENHGRRIVGEGMSVALEMKMCVDAFGFGREGDRPAPSKQVAVAE